MGVDITYTCINNCTIRVHHRVYRDCSGAQAVGNQNFSWQSQPGCIAPQQVGSWVPCNQNGQINCWFVSEVTPVCPGTVTQCTNASSQIRGVEEYYRYADFNICNTNCSNYNIAWWGQNRNGGITSGAANQGIGTNTISLNTSLTTCNNSPQFNNPPVPYLCNSQPFTFNQGASDPDGDSLSYSLGTCNEDNFVSVNYAPGFSPTSPLGPTWNVTINPVTGDVTFTPNPGNIEVGVMCVYVQEWRNGVLINTVVRDMQINVIPCPSNQIPVVNQVANVSNGTGQGGSNTGIVVATCLNNNLCFDLPVIDPNAGDSVTIWWNNGIPGGTFFETGNPTNVDTISGVNPSVTFCWTPTVPGTYSFLVEMMDNACPSFGFSQFTVTIIVSNPLVVANPQPPACDTFTICAFPFGGIPPFTYQWTGQGGLSSTDSCAVHIYPGPGTYTYSLTMTDSIGCTNTYTDSVVVPPIPMPDAGPDLLYCQSGTDTIGGPGAPNETYLWSPTTFLSDPTLPNPVLNITNPGPAVLNIQYILTVTHTQSMCVRMDTMNVTVSYPPQLDFVPTAVECYGNSTGAIDMTINNGLPPFNISWTGPNGFNNSNEDISQLFAGMYYVTVVDSAGCTSVDSVEIVQPDSPLWTNLIPDEVCCTGNSDGSIELIVTGDSPPYFYSWTGPGGFTSSNEDISGLVAGTYYVTVNDTFGCNINDSIVITEPSPVVFNFNVYNAACNSDPSGIIAASVSGGHGNFSYLWSPGGATSDSINNLFAGTYQLQVTDTCYTADTAFLYMEDFEGHSPWTLNVPTGPNGVDRNFWTISDNEGGVLPPGCAAVNNNNRTLHVSNLANANSGADYDAGGFCGQNGTCPETNMRAESPFVNSTGYSNLVLTFDYISVGDGLLDNCSLLFNDGTGWQVLAASLKSLTCNPGQGEWTAFSANLPASCNNIPNLQVGFNWTNNDDGNGSNPSAAINNILITAPRTVNVGTCTWLDSATVGEPPVLTSTIVPVHNLCFGDSAGNATVNAAGGNGNYGYNWSTGGTTQGINGLPAGTYTVTVTDTAYTPAGGALGYLVCSTVDTIEILQPPALVLVPTPTPTSCFLGSDGQVTVAVSGGTPGYGYVWLTNPIQNSQTATGLPTGAYTVVVTDANGCIDSAQTVVTQPPPIVSSATSTNATCGDPTGTATVNSFGGTPGYTYAWSTTPTQTTQTATNLLPGPYTVTITDQNGCSGFAQVVVGNEPRPTVSIDAQTNLLCFGDADGTATAVAMGGTGPYSFLWSNGQTTPQATNLIAGIHTVIVTDAFGCQDTTTVNILQPTPVTATSQVQHMGCNSTIPDGTMGVIPSGGTPGYTYAWSTTPVQTTQQATGLAPGIYSVTITDANGCELIVTDTVIQIPRPDVTAGLDAEFCDGEGGVMINAFGTGGQMPYYYTWYCDTTNTYCGIDSVNDDDPIVNPDTSTWYYVYIVDFNGCVSDTDSVFVTVLPKPVVDAGEDIYMCGDSAPCVVLNPTVTGPAPGPFTYAWSPGAGLNDSTIQNPCARPDTTTIYTLVVTSGNGCTSELTTVDTNATVTVHVNPVPIANAGPDFDICLGDTTVLQGFGTGAGPAYEYQWTPSAGLSDTTIANPLANPTVTTVYSLVVFSNDCPSYADSVEVRVHTIPTVEAGWDREICLGETTILDAQAGGDSTATYTFEWLPLDGMVGSNLLEDVYVSPDSTTAYWVVATTNWGCESDPDTAVVYVKPTPIAEAGDAISICGSDSIQLDGSYYYTTTDSAPVSQIYYSWWPNTNISDTAIADPVVWPTTSTWYYLTVTYNTCSWTDSVFVTVIPEMIGTIDADTTVICSADSVQLYSSGGLGGASFTWTPAAGLSNPNVANPMASPDTTTTYTLVISEGGCDDTLAITIDVIPSPQPAYVSSLDEGCVPHTVNFIQTSVDAIAYIWDFGDGSPIVNEEFPTHVYEAPGVYPVTLTVVTTGNCSATTQDVTVTVLDTAYVDFTSDPASPIEMMLPNTGVEFTNLTTGATSYIWEFGDGIKSTDFSPSHTFMTPGEYFVTLIAANDNGCIGRAMHGPYVIRTPELFIPNVFSPNDDNINDIFLVDYSGSQPFNLKVYDRWGVLVYESRNKTQGWNGKDLNNKDVTDGVYYYHVMVGGKEFTGNVTLVR